MLAGVGLDFDIDPAHIDESLKPGESPEAAARRLAAAKAREVSRRHPTNIVLAADTLVCLGEYAMGKPASHEEAVAMLQKLSGRTHRVITGVCLRRRKPALDETWSSITLVRFKKLDEEIIDRYMTLVKVMDKAGAYAIQEHGGMLVDTIDGLESNVIGLPIEEVLERLARLM